MTKQKVKAILKQAPLEIFTLLSSMIFTSQFERDLDVSQIKVGQVRTLIEAADTLLVHFTSFNQPLGALLYGCAIILVIQHCKGKNIRIGADIVAGFLNISWIAELLLMNALLIAPIKSPVLLMKELLLFIPVVIICFSWWYWRLNLRNKINKRPPAIDVEGRLGVFEYAYVSSAIFFNFSEDRCHGGAAKLVYLINGFVVLNVAGLTLSRAVGLATS